MKRIGNLYNKIFELDNLYLAYNKARKGKGHSYGVLQFELNLTENILQIQKELQQETYKTPEYDIFTIYDPKERIIYRLPFKDRVVHHAIMNILEPIWTSVFISHTYSCIKGKGIHGALKHIKQDLKDKENTKYCLKMDIRKFYPSIDHEIMKAIIRKKIKDVKLLNLLDGIIDSADGVPIGNYLSQFLANLYLSYFDHWMKEKKQVKYYYRYADDIVIFNGSKEYLHNILSDIKEYLQAHLNLQLKSNYQIFPVESRGIDFVGYVFYHTHILMRKTIKKNFCRRVSKLNKKDITVKEYKIKICSWIGWAKHCNSKNLIKTIIKMKNFSDFNINPLEGKEMFVVPKISIMNILNCEIEVVSYEAGVKTEYGNNRYVVKFKQDNKEGKFFTNSSSIKETLDKIPKRDFPFKTVIKKQNFGAGNSGTYYFT